MNNWFKLLHNTLFHLLRENQGNKDHYSSFKLISTDISETYNGFPALTLEYQGDTYKVVLYKQENPNNNKENGNVIPFPTRDRDAADVFIFPSNRDKKTGVLKHINRVQWDRVNKRREAIEKKGRTK